MMAMLRILSIWGLLVFVGQPRRLPHSRRYACPTNFGATEYATLAALGQTNRTRHLLCCPGTKFGPGTPYGCRARKLIAVESIARCSSRESRPDDGAASPSAQAPRHSSADPPNSPDHGRTTACRLRRY